MLTRSISGALRHRLIAHLKKGGVIAYPTESCFGLGCLCNRPDALRRLIRLKKRPNHKGLIVIGYNWTQIQFLVRRLPVDSVHQIESTWQTSCTSFLLPSRETVSPLLRGAGHNKIAVRVPQHQGARNLCRALGVAITSSSANRSGKKVCTSSREAKRQFGKQVMVINGKIGNRKKPSRIVDFVHQTIVR